MEKVGGVKTYAWEETTYIVFAIRLEAIASRLEAIAIDPPVPLRAESRIVRRHLAWPWLQPPARVDPHRAAAAGRARWCAHSLRLQRPTNLVDSFSPPSHHLRVSHRLPLGVDILLVYWFIFISLTSVDAKKIPEFVKDWAHVFQQTADLGI